MNTQINVDVIAIGIIVMMIQVKIRFEQLQTLQHRVVVAADDDDVDCCSSSC